MNANERKATLVESRERWRWSNKGGVLILYASPAGQEPGEHRVVLRTQPQTGTSSYDLTTEDAQQIALAPEMAEAILAYDDCPAMVDHRSVAGHDAILALAAKLREIGGAS